MDSSKGRAFKKILRDLAGVHPGRGERLKKYLYFRFFQRRIQPVGFFFPAYYQRHTACIIPPL